MQGGKDFIGSLPESLAVDHGSTSSDSSVAGQQICWTNFAQNPLAGTNRVTRNLSLWSMGESSSSAVPDHVSQNRVDSKTGHKWSSLVKAHPEPHQHEALPSRLLLSNANMNTTHTRVTVNPSNFNGMKPSMCASSSSGPVEMDGRQLPCKRKAHELNVDQSSSKIGSSNSFQWTEGSSKSVWRSVSEISTPTNTMHELNVDQSSSKIGSLNNFQRPEGSGNSVWRPVSEIPTPTNTMHFDPTIPRLTSGNREVSVDNRGMENIRRNVRIRINSSRQQNQLPATNNNNGLLRNRSSSSRVNGPVNVIGRSRDNSRRIPTNASDHPLFIQPHDIRNPAQTAINSPSDLVGGNMTRNRNASTSNPMPNLDPNHGSSSNSFRSHSEYLRRALSSSIGLGAGGGSGGQSSNLFSGLPPPVGASASSSQESEIPPVIAVTGQNPHYYPPHSRTSDRQLDGAFAFPYPARTVAGGSERRARLTEIRNVLDRLRRGESLRLEDAMILNQSVFYGMAGIHDRHRDMRLDIDNMSYEELLALEERIGNVNTGLTEENVYKHLKQKNYTSVAGQPDDEPCCICQEEYKDGDDLGALECGHEFHTSCIKQWLLKKNLCPVCKSAASK